MKQRESVPEFFFWEILLLMQSGIMGVKCVWVCWRYRVSKRNADRHLRTMQQMADFTKDELVRLRKKGEAL